jgi:hypothetical protein
MPKSTVPLSKFVKVLKKFSPSSQKVLAQKFSIVTRAVVLQADNTPPRFSAMFYMAVVQSVLLYGSESWNLLTRVMARLEGFNIRTAYRMAVLNKPRRGLHHTWVYPRSKDVLNECGMQTISHFIGVRRDTILAYVVNRPIYQKCREGERKRGSAPRQWWWEQPMQLYNNEAVEQ